MSVEHAQATTPTTTKRTVRASTMESRLSTGPSPRAPSGKKGRIDGDRHTGPGAASAGAMDTASRADGRGRRRDDQVGCDLYLCFTRSSYHISGNGTLCG